MATKTVTPTKEAIDAAMAYGRERRDLATLKLERDGSRCFVESL